MGAFDVNKTSCTFAKQSSPSKRRGVTGVKAKGGRRRRRRWRREVGCEQKRGKVPSSSQNYREVSEKRL